MLGGMMVNWNHLYYFNMVAKVGHVTKAAEALYISQPSLSYAISSLEKELGYPLFVHQGRNIVLSQYGQKLYDYTRGAFSQIEIGVKEVGKIALEEKGHLRVACINTVSGDYIPALISEYLKTYPQTTFEVKSGATLDVVRLLKEDKVDIGFCTPVDDDSLQFYPLFHQDFVVIVPRNHELANRKKLKLTDLINYPLISYTHSLPIAKTVQEIFQQESMEPHFVQTLDDEMLIGGMVMQGFGVGIVARTPFLKQFPLKVIPLDIEKKNIRQVNLAIVKDKFRSVSEEKMINLILSKKQ